MNSAKINADRQSYKFKKLYWYLEGAKAAQTKQNMMNLVYRIEDQEGPSSSESEAFQEGYLDTYPKVGSNSVFKPTSER